MERQKFKIFRRVFTSSIRHFKSENFTSFEGQWERLRNRKTHWRTCKVDQTVVLLLLNMKNCDVFVGVVVALGSLRCCNQTVSLILHLRESKLYTRRKTIFETKTQEEVKPELRQPRQRRQQKPHKFAYLTVKNSIFARFARAFLIFWHFEDVLVLSTTWNDLFCSCVDDVSIWWQMFNFVFLCPKRWFQFNSRIVRTHFSSKMTLNNWKMIAETRSYIFRWRSLFLRRVCLLSSLKSNHDNVLRE